MFQTCGNSFPPTARAPAGGRLVPGRAHSPGRRGGRSRAESWVVSQMSWFWRETTRNVCLGFQWRTVQQAALLPAFASVSDPHEPSFEFGALSDWNGHQGSGCAPRMPWAVHTVVRVPRPRAEPDPGIQAQGCASSVPGRPSTVSAPLQEGGGWLPAPSFACV